MRNRIFRNLVKLTIPTVMVIPLQSCLFQVTVSIFISRQNSETYRIRSLTNSWIITELDQKIKEESGSPEKEKTPVPDNITILSNERKTTQMENLTNYVKEMNLLMKQGATAGIFDLTRLETGPERAVMNILFKTRSYGTEIHYIPLAEKNSGDDGSSAAMAYAFLAGAVRTEISFDPSYETVNPVIYYLNERQEVISKNLEYTVISDRKNFSFPPLLLILGLGRKKGWILVFPLKGSVPDLNEISGKLKEYSAVQTTGFEEKSKDTEDAGMLPET